MHSNDVTWKSGIAPMIGSGAVHVLGASSKASISMVRKFVIGRCIEHSAMKVRSRA